MRRSLAIGACFLGLLGAVSLTEVGAADKDTPAAAATRTKKLKAKVTLDYTNEMMRVIFEDIKSQLEGQGVGSLSVKYGLGISMNQRLSIQVKDVTLEEALDKLLGQNGLGYIVISSKEPALARYDGWIEIRMGNERGYPADAAKDDPKTKTTSKTKDDPKTKTTTKTSSSSATNDDKTEAMAKGKLSLIRELINDGNKEKAKTRLEELIKTYPNTKAAEEAKALLEKLGK